MNAPARQAHATDDDRTFLTVAEVADLLRISPTTLYRLIDRHDAPPCSRVGSRIVFSRGDVLRWVAARKEGA